MSASHVATVAVRKGTEHTALPWQRGGEAMGGFTVRRNGVESLGWIIVG